MMDGNKRIYVVMLMLLVIGAMVYWVKTEIDKAGNKDIIEQVKNNTVQIDLTQQKVNQTQAVVNETGKKVNDSLINQATIAKGLNDVGSILIGKINNISDKTRLIDDIKFDTEQILNKTAMQNITLTNITD